METSCPSARDREETWLLSEEVARGCAEAEIGPSEEEAASCHPWERSLWVATSTCGGGCLREEETVPAETSSGWVKNPWENRLCPAEVTGLGVTEVP